MGALPQPTGGHEVDHEGVHSHEDGEYVNVGTPEARHAFILDTLRESAGHHATLPAIMECALTRVMIAFLTQLIGSADHASDDRTWTLAEIKAESLVSRGDMNAHQLALIGEVAHYYIAAAKGQPLPEDVVLAAKPYAQTPEV